MNKKEILTYSIIGFFGLLLMIGIVHRPQLRSQPTPNNESADLSNTNNTTNQENETTDSEKNASEVIDKPEIDNPPEMFPQNEKFFTDNAPIVEEGAEKEAEDMGIQDFTVESYKYNGSKQEFLDAYKEDIDLTVEAIETDSNAGVERTWILYEETSTGQGMSVFGNADDYNFVGFIVYYD